MSYTQAVLDESLSPAITCEFNFGAIRSYSFGAHEFSVICRMRPKLQGKRI